MKMLWEDWRVGPSHVIFQAEKLQGKVVSDLIARMIFALHDNLTLFYKIQFYSTYGQLFLLYENQSCYARLSLCTTSVEESGGKLEWSIVSTDSSFCGDCHGPKRPSPSTPDLLVDPRTVGNR